MKRKVALGIAALAAIGGVTLLARRASASERRELWTREDGTDLPENETAQPGTDAQATIKEE